MVSHSVFPLVLLQTKGSEMPEETSGVSIIDPLVRSIRTAVFRVKRLIPIQY